MWCGTRRARWGPSPATSGIAREGIKAVEPSVAEAATRLLDVLVTDDHEIVTVIEGEEPPRLDADDHRVAGRAPPGVTPEVHHGGQPLPLPVRHRIAAGRAPMSDGPSHSASWPPCRSADRGRPAQAGRPRDARRREPARPADLLPAPLRRPHPRGPHPRPGGGRGGDGHRHGRTGQLAAPGARLAGHGRGQRRQRPLRVTFFNQAARGASSPGHDGGAVRQAGAVQRAPPG